MCFLSLDNESRNSVLFSSFSGLQEAPDLSTVLETLLYLLGLRILLPAFPPCLLILVLIIKFVS